MRSSTFFISLLIPAGFLHWNSSFAEDCVQEPKAPFTQEQMELIRKTAVPIIQLTGERGGTWSGGGGNGVACFASKLIADSAVDSSGSLKASARARIESLTTTDYRQFKDRMEIHPPLQGETSDTYLERILETKIKPLDPEFAGKLKLALQQVSSKPWNPRSDLPKIEDLGETLNVPENCKVVQLVVRYFKSTPGKIPELFFDTDQELLTRLRSGPDAVLNEAFLKLHEAAYLLSGEFGHRESSSSRMIGTFILSAKIQEILEKLPAPDRPASFKNLLLNWGFDQASLLFADRTEYQPSQPSTPSTRRDSYAKMREGLKVSGERWSKATGITPEDLLRAAAHDPYQYMRWGEKMAAAFVRDEMPKLSDEVAFLWLASAISGDPQGAARGFVSGGKSLDPLFSASRDEKSEIRNWCKDVRLASAQVRVLAGPDESRDAVYAKALNFCGRP